MALTFHRVTARKHGRNGTRYSSTVQNCTVTIWPCGRGYGSILRRDGQAPKRGYHGSRADAVIHAGEWLDPSQNGRYILDNDYEAMNAAKQVAA